MPPFFIYLTRFPDKCSAQSTDDGQKIRLTVRHIDNTKC